MTKNEDRINKLFKELVPETGKADSLAGELVRAMSRIAYRFYNDGDIQTMTNKAKTYLKNIQEADTEKKLIGIEIAFKQDMTLSCNDLGSLCRAAEDRRYSLRNNEETLKLKQILFFRTKAEMDAYHDMSRKPEDWTEAELVDEYEAWKVANPNV